jgi:acyl-CoA thioesterase YciA
MSSTRETDGTPEGYTFATRKLVMYSHLNAAGRLFGGLLMSWIDEALAMVAGSVMRTRSIATKKFGEVVFEAPGRAGDVVEIWSKVSHEGRSSLTLEGLVVVHRENFERLVICRCTVVFVAIDPVTERAVPWRAEPDRHEP